MKRAKRDAASESSLSLNYESDSVGEILPDMDEIKNIFSRLQGSEEDLEAKPSPDGKKIKPIPGFCIKTSDSEGRKTFINICQSPDLPAPPYKSEADLMEILQNSEDGGYKVPMSLDAPRPEKDKSGKTCDVYDVIINDDFYAILEKNEVLRSIIMSIVLMGIEDKYKTVLQAESAIVLKNRRYMGNCVREHWVEDRQKLPLITEIESSTKVPEYSLSKKMAPNGSLEEILGEFKLTGITNVDDITLDLGEDRIVLKADDKFQLDIFLPYDIVQDDARAQFHRKNHMLFVTMPVAQVKN